MSDAPYDSSSSSADLTLSAAQLEAIQALFGPPDCGDDAARDLLLDPDVVVVPEVVVVDDDDDDVVQMRTYSAKQLAQKRLDRAVAEGTVVDLCDDDDDVVLFRGGGGKRDGGSTKDQPRPFLGKRRRLDAADDPRDDDTHS